MREELRNLLVSDVVSVNGEVWEPSAAGPDLPKPHLILRESSQDAGEPYANYTAFYEVWPYVERTTFQNVDALSKEVVSAFNKKRFDVKGVPHYIEYSGSSEDVVDDEWDALTRGLRFQIFSLAWLVHTPIEPDPVDAMQRWTAKRFPKLQTDPLKWSPSSENPALYWRHVKVSGVETMNWGAWIDMQLNGHVISPELSTRSEWVERVVRQLAIDLRTSMSDNSKMRFTNISADSGYNPFIDGQIQLTVRFGVLKDPNKLLRNILKNAYFDERRGGIVRV